jgi:hypothetical protein
MKPVLKKKRFIKGKSLLQNRKVLCRFVFLSLVAFDCSIMPVKIADAAGPGTHEDFSMAGLCCCNRERWYLHWHVVPHEFKGKR